MSKRKSKFAEIVPPLIALLLPWLCLYGYIYEAGIFEAYNLDVSFFDGNIQDYLFLSFSVLLKFVNSIVVAWGRLFWITLLIGFLFMLGVAWARYEVKGSPKIGDLVNAVKSKLNTESGRDIAFPIFGFLIGASVPYLCMMILVLGMLLLIWPYFYGRDTASQDIKNYKACMEKDKPTSATGCVYIYREGKLLGAGNLVATDHKQIALYDGTVTIYRIDSQTFVFGHKSLKK